jgi:hypothetical protein
MATSSSPERCAGVRRALACLALAAVALAPTLAGRAALAAESLDACDYFIDAAPYGIDLPGTYCLTQNVSTNSTFLSGVFIDADDVTLDCNGFRIDGTAAGTATVANGVAADSRKNVTVRNCHVRGYQIGIDLYQSSGPGRNHVVEDNRVELSRFTGIFVNGDGSVIRRNLVQNTVGPQAGSEARGIATEGNVDIVDNTVSGVATSNAAAYGIYTQGNEGGSVRGNRVRGVSKNGGAGAVAAINNQDASARMVIRDNNLTGDAQAGSTGVACDVATNRAKANSIKGFAVAVVGCSNDGNVIKP